MNFNRITTWVAIISAVVLVIGAFLVWFFFFRSTGTLTTAGTTSGLFGGNPSTANTTPASTDVSGTQTINTTAAAQQKIFEITAGPVVGATLIETLHPTTTIARYIRQDDGHVFDVPLGVAGAVPRVVSDVTIPGGQRAIWLEGGNAALLQYVDSTGVVKTVYLGFPSSTSTTAVLPTRIEFLPDNIIDIAASPDGNSVVYLIKTSSGSDGYIAKDDGTNSRKTFSLPLSQLLVSWPSTNTILVQTKSAAGVTGIAFAVDVANGSVSQLVTAPGLSTTADPAFSQIVYEKSDGTNQFTYAHSIKNGTDSLLSFSPIPEKCIWSKIYSAVMYCATPLAYVGPDYLDLWHQGEIDSSDGVFGYGLNTGKSEAVAIPGSADGGVSSDILEMSLSPDEQYLSYTTKGDRSLWGVLLEQ